MFQRRSSKEIVARDVHHTTTFSRKSEAENPRLPARALRQGFHPHQGMVRGDAQRAAVIAQSQLSPDSLSEVASHQ
jgi:hypothetical protein